MENARAPVFIHSVFRAGSTYLFDCFRRSPAGYTTYQEPLNEHLLNAAEHPERLLEVHDDMSVYLRHPKLGRPYFAEFHPLAKSIAEVFSKSLCYDEYFFDEQEFDSSLGRYLGVLITGAPGRPVLQECRSTGRTRWLRHQLGGLHVFLWRNPRDQWWSYEVDPYFTRANLLILNAERAPEVFVTLREQLGIQEFHSDDISAEIQHFDRIRLSFRQSYKLFFALWLHAMVMSRPHCHLEISIDQLSSSEEYRSTVLQELESLGVGGLDFSDCRIPQGEYSDTEVERFRTVEEEVFALFVSKGYSRSALQSALSLVAVTNETPRDHRESQRLRQLMLREKDEAARLSETTKSLETQLQNLRSASQLLEHQLVAQQGQVQVLQAVVKARDEQLVQIMSSSSWKVTAPLRRFVQWFRKS